MAVCLEHKGRVLVTQPLGDRHHRLASGQQQRCVVMPHGMARCTSRQASLPDCRGEDPRMVLIDGRDGSPEPVELTSNRVELGKYVERPATATELLEQILARDDTPQSASTMLRERQDPGVRLGVAVERYLDALHVAAEDVSGSGWYCDEGNCFVVPADENLRVALGLSKSHL
jgi:hypothetical protein